MGRIDDAAAGASAPTVSLVVCTLNEQGNVGRVLERVPDVVNEILVVDGHSTDRTVEEAMAADPRVRIVYQSGRGKGDALREGFRRALGDILVQMDADGSMLPEEIPRYVDAVIAGADVVKGSRSIKGGGSADLTPVRWFGNWCFCSLSNLRHGTRFTDICYGFMAFRRSVLEAIEIECDGFDVESELAIKAHHAGCHVVEVPTFEHDRWHGESHLRTVVDGWAILLTILKRPTIKRAHARAAPPTVHAKAPPEAKRHRVTDGG